MTFITGIYKIVIEIILTKAEIKEHYSLTGKKTQKTTHTCSKCQCLIQTGIFFLSENLHDKSK